MFLGHFAVAYAAKKAVPAISLGVLFVAVQLADLVWPILVLMGFERFSIRPGVTAMTPLTHRPDMPLGLGDSGKVGLGLWQSVPATVAVELAMFAGAIAYYGRTTRARDAAGRWGFHALTVLFLLIYVANVFSPAPPSVNAVAWSAMAMWLFVAWGAWIDRHREPA